MNIQANNKNIEVEVPEGYKKTSVGIIPEDWKVKRLGDIAYITTGASNKQDAGDGFKYVFFDRSSDVLTSKIFLYDCEAIIVPGEGADFIPKYFVGKFDLHQRAYAIMDFKNVLGKYIFYYLINDRKHLHRQAVGSTVKSLRLPYFKNMPMRIPSLEEQTAIADCLSTWDKGIEKLSALIASKKEQKKGLMQQLLTGKKRLDGFTEEWKEVRLGEITKRITRKNKELDDTVVTISAQRGFVLQEDYFKKRVASSTLSNYYLLHKGEFAYNKSYSKGYPMGAFKRLDDFDKAVVTTLYICFKLKENVDSDFLLDFFEAGLMINNLMRIAQEGGRAHGLLNIGLADFFNLKLRIPDINEQRAIAEVLTTANKEIELLEKKLESFKTQKKGLMQVLLTGQKRLV